MSGRSAEVTPARAWIAVENLSRRFGRREVLRDVGLELSPGAFLLLLGANGAGKTTLLRILAALLPPSSGRAEVAGHDVRTEPTAVRRAVGYVGHVPLLYRDLTATENLRFYADMYGLPDPAGRAAEMLDRVELRRRSHDTAGELSRGMRQRLAIARALLHDPSVLLLDEPYGGLDDRAATVLDGILDEHVGRTTVVLVTHEPARPMRWASAAREVRDGRLQPLDIHALDVGRR
jgi:heme exporter protein A